MMKYNRWRMWVLLLLLAASLGTAERALAQRSTGANLQAAGTQAAGTQAAGTQAAGTQAAGTQAAGTQAAGTQGAGANIAPQPPAAITTTTSGGATSGSTPPPTTTGGTTPDSTTGEDKQCTSFAQRLSAMQGSSTNTSDGSSMTSTPTGSASTTQGCQDQNTADDGSGSTSSVATNTTSSTDSGCGILSEIYIYIKGILGHATQNLFNSFINSDNYQNAVLAAITLSIIFFGIAFTIGVMQVSFGQVLVRFIKLGIIFTLISPMGWDFFNDNVVRFFTDGTDELVSGVMAIATGVTPPPGSTPFYAFDAMASYLIHPDVLIAIMGSVMAGGPFGMLMGSMMIISMMGFLKLLVNALRLYAVAFIARSLLLGIAPVFIVFLLFERTKNLFISWLNALITMSLQPILMFTFLSFFMVLIQTASTDMFNTELCWTAFQSTEGTNGKWSFWRFVDPTTKKPITSDMTWNGALDCLLSNGSPTGTDTTTGAAATPPTTTAANPGGSATCQEFPINIVNVLSFLILVYLAGRFAESIDRIASELSNAYLLLDTGGKLDQFLSQQGRGGGESIFSRAGNALRGTTPPGSS